MLFGDKTVPGYRWTRPTEVDSLNPDNLQGHIFILTDTGFHPYEYHSGQHPDLGQVDDKFLPELIYFLNTNGLSRIIALEVLDRPLPKAMMELVLGDFGTMMTQPERLKGCKPFRQTGWAFVDEDGEPMVSNDGKQEHVTGPKGHITIVEPPKNTSIETCSDLLHMLRQYGLLN